MSDKRVFYSVVVGNLGYVTNDCEDYDEAKKDFDDYVFISKKDTHHRAYQEQVSLWKSDEDDPIETYEPPVTYRVLVGELGMVAQECTDYGTAKKDYDHYIEESKQNTYARGYQERVELWSSENEDPIDWYEPELSEETDDDDGDAQMHECKFCHCLDTVEGGHACQEFTDAGNAPEGTPEHDLWESVMKGLDSGFLNLDGTEE